VTQQATPERPKVRISQGFPESLNALAERAAGPRHFLRDSWYRAGSADDGKTFIAESRGRLLAAIPTTSLGPSLIGARTVPGSYWPFRSFLVDPDGGVEALAAILSDAETIAALSPVWRVGPVYRDDPAIALIKKAAPRAGWTILLRPLGQTYLFDLGAMLANAAWPRRTTRRRLANYERQLERQGQVGFRTVTGAGWSESVMDALARIESRSWVGQQSDTSGTKFLNPDQRRFWSEALADPAIARCASATILSVGDQPAAFSFDLRSGDVQYSIASSFDEAFASARPGKIVTYRQLQEAGEAGVRQVALGMGDSGYKREMGAVPGPEVIDLLIVRSRPVARILRYHWTGGPGVANAKTQIKGPRRSAARRLVRPVLAAGTIAATAFAIAE